MDEPPKKNRNGWRIALLIGAGLIAVVVVALLVAVYGFGTKIELKKFEFVDDAVEVQIIAPIGEGVASSTLARFATGPLATLQTPSTLVAAPDYVFKTRDGVDTRFAHFRGKVVLINLWAMWCAPCRTEMPTLATLASAYPDGDLVVLPVNVDVGADALADAKSFIDVHDPLPFYSDPKFQLPFEFPGKGKMPQTILVDRQGRIRAAFAGEADWSSPEARALVDAVLAESG